MLQYHLNHVEISMYCLNHIEISMYYLNHIEIPLCCLNHIEIPLILYDTGFEGLRWQTSGRETQQILNQFHHHWTRQAVW